MRTVSRVLGVGVVVLAYAGSASATTINVSTSCSFDQAVQAVNNRTVVGSCPAGNGSSDKIVIPAGTFNIAAVNPVVIRRSVQVVGASQASTTLQCSRHVDQDASGDQRFSVVLDDALATGQTVTFSDLTLKQATGGHVGGLANMGLVGPAMTLAISNVRITGFYITGLQSRAGSTTVNSSLLNNNDVSLDENASGGIQNSAVMNINYSTIDSNQGIGGAGISNHGAGTMYIYASTISNNAEDGFGGGGVYNSGSLIIAHSTISGNFSSGDGGGINTTAGSNLYLGYCTLANNNGFTGGGLRIDPSAYIYMVDSIVANNSDSAGAPDVSGDIIFSQYDLIRNPSGASGGGAGIMFGVDPLLGPLTTVDSTPATHALLPGSPAIDSGISDTSYYPANLDERGFPRPTDGNGDNVVAYDLGAFEFDPWQTERLPVSAKSSDTHSIASDPSYSNGQGTWLQSNATNDFVTYRAPLPSAGTYTVKVRVRRGNNRGKFQVQTASNLNGSYTNLGAVQDAYRSSADFVTVTLGTYTVSSAGTKYFKFLITGKNASSSGYQLTLDYLQFILN